MTPPARTGSSGTQQPARGRSAQPRAGQPAGARGQRTASQRTASQRTTGQRTASQRTASQRTASQRRATAPRRSAAATPTTARRASAGRPTAVRRQRPAAGPTRRPARRTRELRRLPMGRPATRLRTAFVVVSVLLATLGVRLVQLQGLDGKAYAAQAAEQRLRKITVPALRGAIYDRTGQPLAVSEDARAVYADPKEVKDGADAATKPYPVATTAAKLADLLHVPASSLMPKLTASNRFQYLAHGVTPAVGRAISELRLPGIGVVPERRRLYPGGSLAANVVGAVGAQGQGLAGLEYQWDAALRGTDGEQTMQVSIGGTSIPLAGHSAVAPVPGESVQLTIDRDIQYTAQQAIAAQVAKTGADSGSVIVMDPRTGEVLALATAPTFDPGNLRHASAANMADRPVSDIYEPGSVNKVITMSAALQEHLFTPTSPITVPPTYQVAGHTFHDAEHHGTEHLTLTGVLAKSSNIGTIQVAQRLGKLKLYDYVRAFGFGSATGAGLPGEDAGLVPAPDTWSGTTLPTIAFGQGISVNALQVASVYATIANGGVRVPPRVVAATVDAHGVHHPVAGQHPRRVISAGVARKVSDMLEAVTTDQGTAPAARIDGYRVAGKTGTAQRSVGGKYSGYTASFVGFAPADRPQLVVEVVLQNPKNGYFGGTVAAPVFHDVMSFALAVRHVPPTLTKPPVVKLTTD